jgi:hypothetical protein
LDLYFSFSRCFRYEKQFSTETVIHKGVFCMRRFFLITALSLALPAFAQDRPETVKVTGSRITTSSFGPISFSGPGDTKDHACADPTCGGSIDPKEPGDGGGSNAITQTQKDQQNKKAKDEAKKELETIADSIKDKDVNEKSKWWMVGLNFQINGFAWHRMRTKDGVVTEGGTCVNIKVSLTNGFESVPCTDTHVDVQEVRKANGTVENQLLMQYVIYKSCYYERKCGPKYINFVAGSPAELDKILNEVLGEKYF